MIDADKLKELVAKFPVPAAKDGKLAEVDKDATDAAVAELVEGGKDAVVGLVGLEGLSLPPPPQAADATSAARAIQRPNVRSMT